MNTVTNTLLHILFLVIRFIVCTSVFLIVIRLSDWYGLEGTEYYFAGLVAAMIHCLITDKILVTIQNFYVKGNYE